MKRYTALKKREERVKALREASAHTAVARMSDLWIKRTSKNVQGFYNEKESTK